MKEEENKIEKNSDSNKAKGNDLLALIIAAFQIVLPIVIIAILFYTIVFVFLAKVWLKT